MKVSIVTPSLNQGRFIERTLESVANQEGVTIEHVVFDGGSTDETIDILRRHSDRVRWVSENDRGQSNAVNEGIRSTDGAIVGWLNSDDIYLPGAIARVVDYFDANPDIDVVYGMADHIDEEGKVFEPYPTEPWNLERLQDTCFICQPAAFVRRRVFERHGLLDETLDYCMDYEYWLRLGKAGVSFAYLEETLAASRLHDDTKTMRDRVKVHREINHMLKDVLGRVPDRWLWNFAHTVVERTTDRNATPRRFVFRLGFTAFVAALRWNRLPSAGMLAMLAHWVRSAVRP